MNPSKTQKRKRRTARPAKIYWKDALRQIELEDETNQVNRPQVARQSVLILASVLSLALVTTLPTYRRVARLVRLSQGA
jgi:hypothetical protein